MNFKRGIKKIHFKINSINPTISSLVIINILQCIMESLNNKDITPFMATIASTIC